MYACCCIVNPFHSHYSACPDTAVLARCPVSVFCKELRARCKDEPAIEIIPKNSQNFGPVCHEFSKGILGAYLFQVRDVRQWSSDGNKLNYRFRNECVFETGVKDAKHRQNSIEQTWTCNSSPKETTVGGIDKCSTTSGFHGCESPHDFS